MENNGFDFNALRNITSSVLNTDLSNDKSDNKHDNNSSQKQKQQQQLFSISRSTNQNQNQEVEAPKGFKFMRVKKPDSSSTSSSATSTTRPFAFAGFHQQQNQQYQTPRIKIRPLPSSPPVIPTPSAGEDASSSPFAGLFKTPANEDNLLKQTMPPPPPRSSSRLSVRSRSRTSLDMQNDSMCLDEHRSVDEGDFAVPPQQSTSMNPPSTPHRSQNASSSRLSNPLILSTPQRVPLPPSAPATPSHFANASQTLDSDILTGLCDDLAEQTRRSQSLLSQLISSKSAHESYASDASAQISSLQTQLYSSQQELSETQTKLTSELNTVYAELASARADLAKANAELEREVPALKSELEDLKSRRCVGDEEKKALCLELEDVKREAEERRKELDMVRSEREKEKEDTRMVVDNARRGVRDALESYASLESNIAAFKKVHDASLGTLADAVGEVREARSFSEKKLNAIEPLLDETTQLAHVAQLKAVVAELQDELAGSHRVNDLLRDKLHVISSQLAESQGRAHELEEERKGIWGGLMKEGRDGVQGLASVEEKVARLTARLEEREKETFSALAEASALEARLAETKKAQREKEIELETLKVVSEESEAQLKEARTIVTRLERQNEILREDLLKLETRNKELQELYENSKQSLSDRQAEAAQNESMLASQTHALNALKAKVEELSQSLVLVQAADKKKQEELLDITVREAMATGRVETLENDLVKMKRDAEIKEETLRKLASTSSVLQERFDAQAMTLRLAKEQSSDLQDRLLFAETSNAAKLEAAIGELKAEIAVLREQKSGLQTTINELREDAAIKQSAFIGANVEFEKKLIKQEEASERLVQSEQRRAVAAENLVVSLGIESEQTKQLVAELRAKLESVMRELLEVRREADVTNMAIEDEEKRVLRGQVTELELQVTGLECQVADLQANASGLMTRYQKGNLMDHEKEFVNSLMQISQAIHEQEAVAKDNEIRRRDNMVNTLQAKITSLEAALAKLLKQNGQVSGPENASMIDLKIWMASSSQEDSDEHPQSVTVTMNGQADLTPLIRATPILEPAAAPVPPPVKSAISTKSRLLRSASATVAPPIPDRKQPAISLTKIANLDSDDEDDIPLSELSQISEIARKRLRPPSPFPVDEPVRSRRRLRTVSTQQKAEPVAPAAPKKPNEGTAKTRQKKRK